MNGSTNHSTVGAPVSESTLRTDLVRLHEDLAETRTLFHALVERLQPVLRDRQDEGATKANGGPLSELSQTRQSVLAALDTVWDLQSDIKVVMQHLDL